MHQFGFTPLTCVATYGRLPMVEHLVESGANMEAKDDVTNVTMDMKPHAITPTL